MLRHSPTGASIHCSEQNRLNRLFRHFNCSILQMFIRFFRSCKIQKVMAKKLKEQVHVRKTA